MNIERVDVIHVRIPLVIPYETSYTPNLFVDKLILKVHTPDAVVFSECVCKDRPDSTYETPQTVLAVLKHFILPLVMNQYLAGPDDYAERVRPIKGHPMAKAAVENAVWAHEALAAGLPLARLLGGVRSKVPVGMGIGIQPDVGRLLSLVDQYLAEGFGRIKIKIKPGWDLEPLTAIRAAHPDLPLMVDANNAYDYDRDLGRLKDLDRFDLTMIEQPLTHQDLHYHARLQRQLATPICLDESITSPYTARVAAEIGAARIINIKQGRVGGLGPSKRIHDIARSHGLTCWVGQMIETGVGLTYGLAAAALEGCVHPNDTLPTRYYAADDLIDPPLKLNHDSTVDVPGRPGLGVEVDPKRLDRHTRAVEVIRSPSS
jgi:O-succinylbenzoate synthase